MTTSNLNITWKAVGSALLTIVLTGGATWAWAVENRIRDVEIGQAEIQADVKATHKEVKRVYRKLDNLEDYLRERPSPGRGTTIDPSSIIEVH